ncbi:brown fat uncoupling protein, putative [Pediculus humanus corporis]|uniref:Brown fat uncoupling protein, putative n=1 Tax=Pediculus humanus subsp. corporis TaxID=121224 RepID=E0VR00_PEDHC|nr:brown fat uncoupling protein, putative [Pediculus humanus corporis]EEB15806.1 brown fat uncoupling protein, putative [Pediculus humanus corporis]
MNVRKFEETAIGVKLLTAGSAACIADIVTFPLDTSKVQGEGKQLIIGEKRIFHYKGVFNTISTIVKEEGPRNLYKGLSAGLQRQMCFASVRIGMYDNVKSFYQNLINEKKLNNLLDVLTKISAGITTGILGVLVAQPTDVVKVRFQAQQGNLKSRYKSTVEAYKCIFKEEGIRGLWKGMYSNMARNTIVNVSEIVCYDIVKTSILKKKLFEDNIYCHFTSASITGLATTIVSSPVDVIKTRYMNSIPGQYTNALDCAFKTIKMEGLSALYKGFTPSFYRLVSWNIVMWVTYEKLKILAVNTFY